MSFPTGDKFYPDFQDGKYGFNTDPNRGADSFRPFSSDFKLINKQENIRMNTSTYTIPNSAGKRFVAIVGGNMNAQSYAVTLSNISNYSILELSLYSTGYNEWTLCRIFGIPSKTEDIVVNLSRNDGAAGVISYAIYE